MLLEKYNTRLFNSLRTCTKRRDQTNRIRILPSSISFNKLAKIYNKSTKKPWKKYIKEPTKLKIPLKKKLTKNKATPRKIPEITLNNLTKKTTKVKSKTLKTGEETETKIKAQESKKDQSMSPMRRVGLKTHLMSQKAHKKQGRRKRKRKIDLEARTKAKRSRGSDQRTEIEKRKRRRTSTNRRRWRRRKRRRVTNEARAGTKRRNTIDPIIKSMI